MVRAARSVEIELVQAFVVDAGVVGKLVQHGAADLVGQFGRVGKIFLEGQPEERDLVGHGRPIRAPRRRRNALVQAIQRLVIVQPFFTELFRRRLVVDDDGHVLEQPLDVRRQPVEGGSDKLLEAVVVRRAGVAAAVARGAMGGGGPASRGV